ncbi:Tetratricopeptide TPR_2 repeat protein [Parafrankia sp. EAN1pec]|uniref:tetratricopeptide repeat protein n=1 Tax=Parafrankia sp. (strain EAN1pec) TaxID=298653 RepID=UPI00005427DC|nr:Tetratricopeptide TPR_2 repeat protein [Frankia sp. EAN1pec]
MTDSFDVFVSYGHDDQVWVRALAENLERAGLHVFYDEWEILAGDVLAHRLDAGVLGSTSGILVVSPHALSRPWVREEYAAMLTRAVAGQQRLIPVILEDAELPAFLASRVWVDFRDTHDPATYTVRVGELVASLRGQRRSRPAADGTVRPPPGQAYVAEGPRVATLRITPDRVELHTTGGTVEGRPVGMDWSAGQVLGELERVRTRRTASGLALKAPAAGGVAADPLDGALRAVGRMLGERFLPADVAAGLAGEVDAAVRGGVSLQLAVQTADGVADLPWETLTLPAHTRPLVLHPGVQLYRAVVGLGATPAMGIRGPLRILAVIASPDHGGGALLDYEAELARILDAVDPARRKGEAYVRILNGGSREAIRAALLQERFHVLHLSCHAEPGRLVLEAEDGAADLVDTQRFVEEVLVVGRGVPLVVLAGCSTALHSGSAVDPNEEQAGGGAGLLPGLARGLLAHGVPAVLAMTAPVSDLYATDLASRLYGELAGRAVVAPLAALTDARQAVETSRVGLPASDRRAGLAEWATPALFLRGPVLPLYDPAAGFDTITEPVTPVLAEGIVVRRVGEFVGRRTELRTLHRALHGEGAGVVLHGIGGVGKSTLAAQLLTDLGDDAGLVVSLTGPVAVDQILAAIAARLASWCLKHNINIDDVRRRLIDALRSGAPWQERVALLAEHLLPTVPVTLFLDNAEDTLTPHGVGHRFTDPQLNAFLAAWVGLPGRARLLVTSRYPLPVDTATAHRLTVHHLGPLSVAEARKLLWRLPALDALTANEQARAIADVGGHPRTLEYLDALLAGGHAHFPEIATRLENTLKTRGVTDPAAWYTTLAGNIDRALAETITLAVDDIVLDTLLTRLDTIPLARRLLTGAAVYRLPVDRNGLAWQISTTVEPTPDSAQDPDIARILKFLAEARTSGVTALEDAGLTDTQIQRYQRWVEQQRRPPLAIPQEFDTALTSLLELGLLSPTRDTGGQLAFTVHRWTATALLSRATPHDHTDAHHRAAAYWEWRVAVWPQDQYTDVTQLLEAGHHHLTTGAHDRIDQTTGAACQQLHTWGLWAWEEQICRHSLNRLPTTDTSRLTAAFTQQLGMIAQLWGDYTTAENRYHKSLAIFQELGDQAGIANCYHQLGRITQERADYTTAENRYQKSLTIREELGDRAGIATSHHQLGIIAQDRGDHTTAENRYQKALTIFQELGDRAGIAGSYGQLGMIAELRGDYTTAENRYQKALTIREELGDRAGIATSHHQLGIIAQDRGDHTTAENRYQKALTIREELGDRAGIATSHHQLGIIAQDRGDYTTAENRYQKALTIFQELGDRAGIAGSYGQLGMIAELRGDYTTAENLYQRTLTIFRELGNRVGIATSYQRLGIVAELVEDYATAEENHQKSLAIFKELGHRMGISTSHLQIGVIAQNQGDYTTAEKRYQKALTIFQELGKRADIAATASQIGVLYTTRDRIADAIPYNLTALSIRLSIKSPESAIDIHWLKKQREALTDAGFRAALANHVSHNDINTTIDFLDSIPE